MRRKQLRRSRKIFNIPVCLLPYEWLKNSRLPRECHGTLGKSCKLFSFSFNRPSTVDYNASSDWKIKTSLCSATHIRWQRGTARIREPPAAATAVDRNLLPAEFTAANLQQRVCYCGPMLGQTDRQTDGRTDTVTYRYMVAYTMRRVPNKSHSITQAARKLVPSAI